jgi:hypothetical protein
MGFLRKLLGSAPPDPAAELQAALEAAEAVRALPEIGGDPAKDREIAALIVNLKAAESALASGRDDQGIPTKPSEIADRLQRTLGYMKQRGNWARLNAKASGDARSKLARLDKAAESSVKALRA